MLKLKEKIANHKTISSLLLTVAICAACVGGYYAYQWYQYRQSPEYAVEKLKETLNPPNLEKLALHVDFRSVSHDLSLAIARTFPFYKAGPDQERSIRHGLQQALLDRLSSKEDPPEFVPDEDEIKNLQKPLVILPGDFMQQLASSLALKEVRHDSALLTAKIVNPQLEHPISFIFRMRKDDDWRVTNLVNASEITALVREDLLKRHARLREVFVEKNKTTRKNMDQLLPILSCSADGGLLSDGKTFIMMIHIIARNSGQIQANNFSVDVSVSGKNGNIITRRYLNAAKPVAPGEDFSHRWSFELDSQSKLAQDLMADIPLHCKANWQTLGLSNAQVWHIDEIPNPDLACQIKGHKHPKGFCIIPIFQP